jgi:hypothetical protein
VKRRIHPRKDAQNDRLTSAFSPWGREPETLHRVGRNPAACGGLKPLSDIVDASTGTGHVARSSDGR